MDLRAYQEASRDTAWLPASCDRLIYFVVGLAGEAGELLEKAEADDPSHEGLMGEMGDVLWYLNHVAVTLDSDMEALSHASDEELAYVAAHHGASDLVVRISRLAECAKKLLRDDGGQMTPERHARLEGLLSAALACWLALTEASGIDPEECAAANILKVASRLERGVVSGDGDHR
jgi:NTP pyrophosphatase (non-canonical NTP hydrolase)